MTSATRFSASAGALKSQNEQTAKTMAPTARISKFPIGNKADPIIRFTNHNICAKVWAFCDFAHS